jgi:hypothetical protein
MTPEEPTPMSQHDPSDGLSADELQAQSAAALPDREAMSTLDPTASLTDVPGLLDLDVNLDLDADAAAPISAAVAANANVAAPIDAAVSANVLSPDGTSMAVADQDSTIVQHLDGTADASVVQDSTIDQGEAAP